MARTKQEIEATKKDLIAGLTSIICGYELIDSVMTKLPHSSMRTAHQSLDRRTGEYVTHSRGGVMVDYIDSKGQHYNIRIRREE